LHNVQTFQKTWFFFSFITFWWHVFPFWTIEQQNKKIFVVIGIATK
jgi:hypothetical protein